MALLALLYYMLPAYIANMAPVFARKLPFLDVPVDFGATWHGKRILGSHKTWRGILIGIAAGTLTAYGQYLFGPQSLALANYDSWLALGLLLSTGALLGDLIKSFAKRRLAIPSGHAWIPFDQVDYAIGALALGSIIYFPGWTSSAVIILVSIALHFIVNIIGYYLNIRKQPW